MLGPPLLSESACEHTGPNSDVESESWHYVTHTAGEMLHIEELQIQHK